MMGAIAPIWDGSEPCPAWCSWALFQSSNYTAINFTVFRGKVRPNADNYHP
jgi:hypothetical protein